MQVYNIQQRKAALILSLNTHKQRADEEMKDEAIYKMHSVCGTMLYNENQNSVVLYIAGRHQQQHGDKQDPRLLLNCHLHNFRATKCIGNLCSKVEAIRPRILPEGDRVPGYTAYVGKNISVG